jgi:hypothetical protein
MKRPPIASDTEKSPSTMGRKEGRPQPAAPSRSRRIVRVVVGRRAIELAYQELR